MMGPILKLDPAGLRLQADRPLSPQIHAQLKERILQGLSSGQPTVSVQSDEPPAALRLPTTRELALALGVSRNTVVRAYEQLAIEGFLQGRVGAGSYVSSLRDGATGHMPKQTVAPEQPDTALWRQLQQYTPPRTANGPPRAFRHGVPALDLFPTEVWARLQARFWRHAKRQPLGYSDAAGLPRLREHVAGYLGNARALPCSPQQVIITSGSQQAIALAALALLGPNDRAAIESPGYRSAAAALALSGARLLRVPVDEQGLQVAALEALGACRLALVSPSHQFPCGVAMSLQRRLDLLAWARRHDAYVLEDDYDGEYRYKGVPLAPLASLDDKDRTLYVGTFSKLLFPGLRLGYLVAPAHLAETLGKLRGVLDRHASIADQSVLADFIEQGHFLRHVRRLRRAAQARRDALLNSWQQRFGSTLPLAPVDAGLHALLPLQDSAQEERLHGLAWAHGIELGSLRQVGDALPASGRAGLLLGFAAVTEAQIEAAVSTLARAWR